MQDYKRSFIEFMLRCEVLSFGDFTTKSGRKLKFPWKLVTDMKAETTYAFIQGATFSSRAQ